MSGELSQEYLKQLLDFDQESGIFTWLVNRAGRAQCGVVAGTAHTAGYVQIRINKRHYFAHRLAWLYVYGMLPEKQIDHINGVRNDNRICNLREADDACQQQNRCLHKRNTSGYPGVTWSKRFLRWRAYVKVNYKQHYLGMYKTKEEAYSAYLEGKARLHSFNPTDRAI